MSLRADTTQLIAGSLVASLYPGLGIPGAAVPSTGARGPGLLFNDISLPGEAADEFMCRILTAPAGTLTLYEDSSFTYTGSGGSGTYQGLKNGVSYGTGVFTIFIGTAPTIGTQPAAQTVTEGAVATFSVAASGTAPLAYQWRFNGLPVAGATSSSYARTTVLSDSGGLVSVVVTNGAGSITSSNAALTVNAAAAVPVAPFFTLNPSSQAIAASNPVTFTVALTGSPTPTVQWRRGGVAIVGAVGLSYTFTTVETDNGASFDVLATNTGGSTTSLAAVLTVIPADAAPVAIVDFDRWLPFVLPDAPGCPRDTAIHHIRQAAIEFLELTHAWQVELPAVQSVAGETDYPLTLPSASAAVKLFAFSCGENEGRVIDAADGRSKRAAWHRDEFAAWIVNRSTVGINPAPSAAAVPLVFRVSLKPTQAALDVPDEIFEHYADAIGTGALARVLKLGGQAWTDVRRSAMLREEFDQAVDKVQWQVQKNFGRTAQRTRTLWF